MCEKWQQACSSGALARINSRVCRQCRHGRDELEKTRSERVGQSLREATAAWDWYATGAVCTRQGGPSAASLGSQSIPLTLVWPNQDLFSRCGLRIDASSHAGNHRHGVTPAEHSHAAAGGASACGEGGLAHQAQENALGGVVGDGDMQLSGVRVCGVGEWWGMCSVSAAS